MNVKVFRESKDIPLPSYAKDGDACMDVTAFRIEEVKDVYSNLYKVIIHTGLHFEIPDGYEIQVRPRSNLTKYRWTIVNSPCTIDSSYRGELMIVFTPLDMGIPFPYTQGMRVAQLCVQKVIPLEWSEVEDFDELSVTDRGSGGFGSTNVHL